MFRVLSVGVVLLLLRLPSACTANSQCRMRGVAISPDGKLIAVACGNHITSFIYKIAVDTGIAIRLTDVKVGRESNPAFSTDGRRIAFTYRGVNGAYSEMVLANVDGSGLQHWPASGSSNTFYPVFSPDNKTIVFGRSGFYGSYSPIAQPHLHAWNFYASDLDGSNVRQITDESFYGATAPSVSPDGKRMALMTIGVDTPQQIAIYSLDHLGKPLLSLRPHVPREADRKEPIVDYPNYMPDGKSILFMAASNGKGLWKGFDYDVYRVDIATEALEQLTQGNGYATDLKVSADGSTAVFLKWHSDWRGTPEKSEVYLLDVKNRKLTPLRVTGLN